MGKSNKIIIMYILISGIASYISEPIIAIYLSTQSVSVVFIGIFIGLPSIVSSMFGFLCSYIVNRLGYRFSFILSQTLYILYFILLIYSHNIIILVCAAFIRGISRILWEPLLKSALSLTAREHEIETVFKIRYIVICVAAIIGPVMIIILSRLGIALFGNMIISIILSVLLLFGIIIMPRNEPCKKDKNNAKVSKPARKSRSIFSIRFIVLGFVILNFFIFMVFSIFEETIPLALSLNIANSEIIFSELLLLNSILGIVIQISNMRFFPKIKPINSILIGIVFFASSFLLFSIAFTNINVLIPLMFVAAILFTFGETLCLPNMDVVITGITSIQEREFVYGLSELQSFGFFAGPALFALILERSGASFMFAIAFVISILLSISLLIYKKVSVKPVAAS